MDSIGYLVVNVNAADGTIPIKDAYVAVYDADKTGSIVASRYTGENGKTDKIELEAPPKALSEAPENRERPYAVYNVEVKAYGFYDLYSIEVPIFERITSVVPAAMQAKPEFNAEALRPELGLYNKNTEPDLRGGKA